MVTLAMMFMLNILMAGVEKTQAGLTCTIIIKNMAGVIMDGVIMDGVIMDGVMINIMDGVMRNIMDGVIMVGVMRNIMDGVIMDGVIMDGAIRNTMDGVIKNIMVGAGINTLINYGNWLLASAFAIQFF